MLVPKHLVTILLVLSCCLVFSTQSHAWDSATHRLITRLAINALPPSPLKIALTRNERLVEQHSIEPDSVLKHRDGHTEEIRHYIDLEIYSRDPDAALASLDPDLATMRERVGEMKLRSSGTLPWTIEDIARRFSADLREGDCAEMLREAGYLAHYVGDASQPLHSTVHFDGYRHDRGIHARVEGAVDDRASYLEATARDQVKVQPITAVWPIEIEEIQIANSRLRELIQADRRARRAARKGPEYTESLFATAGPMFTQQVASAASTLASIWQYEWTTAGSPSACMTRR
jgi:hypothetical protein